MIEPRYRLLAYVCTGGIVHEQADEGHSTLKSILTRRPEGCKYAILEDAAGVLTANMFDLYWLDPDDRELGMRLGEHVRHQTYDTAIMATAMTYFLVKRD